MDDLKKALSRKLEKQFSSAGWQGHAEGLDTNPVRFWLYSTSLDGGPRLVSQIGAEFHRELVSRTGMVAELATQFKNPGDALAGMIDLFDQATGAGQQTEDIRQFLTVLMGLYARSTRTWAVMSPLNAVPGTHFVIIDWLAADGKTKILRPAHLHRDGPMSEQDLLEFQKMVVAMHLRNRPGDAPLKPFQ